MAYSVRLAILFILNIALLSGCWNYREINDLAIVSGLAVDKHPTEDRYHITFEIVNFEGGGRDTKISSHTVESAGKTIFDAVRNAIKISGKKLYWSHASVVVISQDIARKGILQTLDFINRDAEPREQMHILISKEKTAKVILEQKGMTSDIRAFELDTMVESGVNLGKAPIVKVHDIINMLSGEGISISLPAVGLMENEGRKTCELSGTAIFKQDKLIGFLQPDESKYFLFVKDKIKSAILTIKIGEKSLYENITMEVFGNKTRITPVNSDGKIEINIDIKTKVSVSEVDISKNVLDDKGRGKLKDEAESLLGTNVEKVIRRVQNDFGVDVFGFGEIVKKKAPRVWKSINTQWNDLFRSLDTNIKVEISIIGSGLVSKSIKIGD